MPVQASFCRPFRSVVNTKKFHSCAPKISVGNRTEVNSSKIYRSNLITKSEPLSQEWPNCLEIGGGDFWKPGKLYVAGGCSRGLRCALHSHRPYTQASHRIHPWSSLGTPYVFAVFDHGLPPGQAHPGPGGGVENVSQQHPRSQSAGPFEPDTVPCTYPPLETRFP